MHTLESLFKPSFQSLELSEIGSVWSGDEKKQRKSVLQSFQNIEVPNRKSDLWRYQSLRPLTELIGKLQHLPSQRKDASTSSTTPSSVEGSAFKAVVDALTPQATLVWKSNELIKGPGSSGFTVSQTLESQSNPSSPGVSHQDFTSEVPRLLSEKFFHIRISNDLNSQTLHLDQYFAEANKLRADHLNISLETKTHCTMILTQEFELTRSSQVLFSKINFILEEGSTLEVLRLQSNADFSTNNSLCKLENWNVNVKENASFKLFSVDCAADVSKFSCTVILEGKSSQCSLGAISLVGNEKKHQNEISVYHQAPSTTSKQMFFQTARDGGVAIFNGSVRIGRACIGSSGEQLNRSYVLDQKSRAYSKPELWIDCDDVKCSHGSSTVSVDPDELFYLQSRGLRKQEALDLLEKSFLGRSMIQAAPWLETRIQSCILDTLVQRSAQKSEYRGTH